MKEKIDEINVIIINTEDAAYTYKSQRPELSDIKAVDGINSVFRRGSFTAIIGRNGSGKSTFAKLLNALLLPVRGLVYVDGISTDSEKYLWDIRRIVGMIFQNPDNQIVGTTVEEDVAFGLENLGVEPSEIRRRVDAALCTTGIKEFMTTQPHHLSGGQKQKVAIAGIIAMKPECIVLDEATSMLDPIGRNEVMAVMRQLNREENITVIHITHHMDEACFADRVMIMDEGRMVMEGTPKEVFSQVRKVKSLGMDVPQVSELMYELNLEGFGFPEGILDIDGAYDAIAKRITAENNRRETSSGGHDADNR
ncbi:MAG: energy-coupling factor transporter ATPase [Eubacteriales bacterium]|nr:energy-coupling factor transporter ATPase [Eubacteriales bacterium]